MAEEVIGLLFGVDGSGSIDGRSGQQIVRDLTKIVNQINSGKSTVPKVQLKFDTSHAKTALQELKTQLQEIAGMGNISVSGMSSRGGSGGSAGVKQDAENYRALTTTVKQYYAALAEVEKIQMKSTAVSSSGGVWSTTDAQYDARIQKVNQLKMDFDKLGVSVTKEGMLEMNSAQQLNITEEQRAMLLAQIQSAITANGIAHEKSSAQISATWDKNAAKVHEYILRMQDVASKNAKVNALMTELNTLAASGNPQNLDELTAKFAQLQQKVRETNADVQTFGQKLSKTFGSQLRYMLTSMVYMKALQFIRDLYNNVVELDKAMTNLQIASGKSRAEIKELTKGYAELAKELGATTIEIAEAADTWLRQGYSAEESNTLIKNSTMLAKLGQMEAAEASKALTSAMKGYKVEVEDSIGIVDKFTAVDMEAAASAGDIATAMAETATSADIAGVSMDRLIGYITIVKAVTQDGAESVGTFYKTLFARMNNVKAGKFVDDETGESLNDVEKVLGELDIKLRDTNGLFRESSDVLDEVGERWSQFDNVQQHAIATAFAGTRQQEKFIVLMENYGTALSYAETAASSAGTAVEKFGAYTDSIEGKMNALKAAFEKFSLAFLDSDLVVGVIEFFTVIMNGIAGVTSFIDSIGGLPTVLLAVASALLLVNGGLIAYNVQMKITTAYTAILGFFTKLKTGLMSIVHAIPNAIAAWKAYAAGTVSASTAMQASIPVIGLVLAAVTALVGALSLASGASDKAAQKTREAADAAATLSDEVTELTYKYLALSDAINTDDAAKESLLQTQDELLNKLKLEKYEVEDLIKKYGSYTEAIKNASIEQLEVDERDLRGDLLTTEEGLRHEAGEKSWGDSFMQLSGSDFVGTSNDPDSGNYDGYAALKALEDAGYISSSSYSSYTDGNGKKYSQGFTMYHRYKYNDMQTPEDIMQAYNDLGVMLDIVGNTAGNNNFVHEALYNEYKSMSEYVNAYKTSVNNLNDNLAQQYTLSALIGRELPKTKEEFDAYRQEVINNAVSSGEFAGSAEEIANAIDSVLSKQSSFTNFYNVTSEGAEGATVALKSAFDILEEVQDGYDGLADALTNVTSEGYLTADALASLAKLEKDGALAGLKLADILTQDANGYKLAENALQQYVQALIAQYTITEAFATLQDKENAIANLKTLQAVLATLAQTQEESTNADKARREELEKQQDAYKDQLDAYRELIDLRKDLLQTYEEELSYQKELAKRQRNVAALQTKLSVARLDQSAAGQARARELEAELKEAQEELDDFTLEHAIEVLTNQLENQYSEYEIFIKTKLDEIKLLLEGLDASTEVNVAIDTSWMQDSLLQIEGAIARIEASVVPEDENNKNPADTKYVMWDFDHSPEKAATTARFRKAGIYHSGGLVGGIANLSSNEEFAKLLKGEFVSTPSQMKRFMEETLPKIAHYSSTGNSNEFNAPLIEILCESVTSESLPELKRIVEEAVKELQKQLDSGMSRTGFKRTPTKRLT